MSENEAERSRSEHSKSATADSGVATDVRANVSTSADTNTTANKNTNASASYPLIQHVQMPGKNGTKATNTANSQSPGNSTDNKDKKAVPKPDPTRYGDWEKNGRCIDF